MQPVDTAQGEALFRETLLFWRVFAEYGLNASLFLDLFPSLAPRLTAPMASVKATETASLLLTTAEALVHVSARGAGLTWPQPLAFIDPALLILAQMRSVTSLSPPAIALVAASASYVARYAPTTTIRVSLPHAFFAIAVILSTVLHSQDILNRQTHRQ